MEDFVWWLRELDFKKKLMLFLGFLLLLFCIFWFRPLPKEITQNLNYADGSHNSRFVEGTCRFFDDVVAYQKLDGTREIKSRDHYLSLYEELFKADVEKDMISVRKTTHVKFRWTGIFRLTEVVDTAFIKTLPDKSRRATLQRLALHWRKTELGWRVQEIRVLSSQGYRKAQQK